MFKIGGRGCVWACLHQCEHIMVVGQHLRQHPTRVVEMVIGLRVRPHPACEVVM